MPRTASTGTHAPKIATLKLPELRLTSPDELRVRSDFDGEHISDASTDSDDLTSSTFTDSELTGWNIHDTNLQGSRFLNTRIHRLNAPVLYVRRTSWREVEISSSRIGSAEWYESDLNHIDVSSSKLGWLNFRASHLVDVQIRDSQIEELDLSGATVTRVALTNTVVNKLLLTKSKIQHLDLRGAQLRSIQGLDMLRGVTLNTSQVAEMAHLFADHLGIVIED